MDLPTVTITVPVLPRPLPTAHQDLMDLFYGHWRGLTAQVRENNSALHEGCCDIFIAPDIPGMLRGPRQDEIAAVFPPKVVAAVMLGNLNYQVENGGIVQWDDNGFSASVDALITLFSGAKRLEIEGAGEMLSILRAFVKRRAAAAEAGPAGLYGDDGDDGVYETYDDLTARFHAIGALPLIQSVLDRFDEAMGASFETRTLRRAA